MKYLTLYHNNSTAKTLSDFMELEYISSSNISVSKLFELNRTLIFNQMSLSQKASYAKSLGKSSITADDLSSSMTLPFPCILKIDVDYVTFELGISETNFEVNTDKLYAFENEQIQNILQDEGYRIDKSTRKFVADCTILGWFKSLYYAGNLSGTNSFYKADDNKFLDISKFVVNVNTSVNSEGGTFSITFPIINSLEEIIKKETNVKENGKKLSYVDRTAKSQDIYDFDNSFFHKTAISSMEHNYFNWLIQSNDLLFISFEKLEMQKNTTTNLNVFDMIGLVENVNVIQNGDGEGSVEVTGRDLMKLITDDNSLFFNTSTAWGESQIFANTESVGKQGDIRDADMRGGTYNNPFNRLRRVTNQIDIFASPFNRSIDFVIKGVISQLANIEVVPDFVFESWGNRRTKFSEIYPDTSTSSGGNGTGGGGSGTGKLGNTQSGGGISDVRGTGLELNQNKSQFKPIRSFNDNKINSGSTPNLNGVKIDIGKLKKG